MTDYIETKTNDGKTIRVEVNATARAATGFGGRQATANNLSNEAVADSYDQVLNTIHTWANGFIDAVQSLEATPSAASLDFAIRIDADTGALVARSNEDAQFKVSLSWKQVEPDKEKDRV